MISMSQVERQPLGVDDLTLSHELAVCTASELGVCTRELVHAGADREEVGAVHFELS